MDWSFEWIGTGFSPRQVEYNPENAKQLIFGTVFGEVCGVDLESKRITSYGFRDARRIDDIIAMKWLHKDANHLFLAASTGGRLTSNDSRIGFHDIYQSSNSSRGIVKEYDRIPGELSCVDASCDNRIILISGNDELNNGFLHLCDLETGKSLGFYDSIHEKDINVAKWFHHHPSLLTTSSYDKTIKTWDIRMNFKSPIYKINSSQSVITISLSNDDNFLLSASGLENGNPFDNKVNQYFLLDGRHHLQLSLPGSSKISGSMLENGDGNHSKGMCVEGWSCTRAYYSGSGRHILVGNTEDSDVHFYNTFTGEYLTSINVYPNKKDNSLYIQTLRGHPQNDNEFCALVNYQSAVDQRELIIVKGRPHPRTDNDIYIGSQVANWGSFQENAEGENLTSVPTWAPSSLRDDLSQLRRNLLDETPRHGAVDEILELVHQNENNVVETNSPFRSRRDKLHDLILQLNQSQLQKLHLHTFVVLSRCPLLYSLYASQKHSNNSSQIDLTDIVDVQRWYLMPLLIDFLYIGHDALQQSTLRAYALTRFYLNKQNTDGEGDVIHVVEGLFSLNFDGFEGKSDNITAIIERLSSTLALVWMCAGDVDRSMFDKRVWSIWNGFGQGLLLLELNRVLYDLYDLGKSFKLNDLQNQAAELLGNSLAPLNVMDVASWALNNKELALYERCMIFMAKIVPFFPTKESAKTAKDGSDVADKVIHDFREIQRRSSCQVLTRGEIVVGPTSPHESSAKQIFGPYHHTSCLFQNRHIVLFGGKIRQQGRWNTKVNRHGDYLEVEDDEDDNEDDDHDFGGLTKLLVYDTQDNVFSHLYMTSRQDDWDSLPQSATNTTVLPLTKENAHQAIFAGGGGVLNGNTKRCKWSLDPSLIPPDEEDCLAVLKRLSHHNALWYELYQKNALTSRRHKPQEVNNPDGDEVSRDEDQDEPDGEDIACVVYEFDFITSTWNAVKLELDIIDTTEIRHEDDENTLFNSLRHAWQQRTCCSQAAMYLEDVPYRCSKCLFQPPSFSKTCSCSFKTDKTERNQEPQDSAAYMFQFGGYDETIEETSASNELHVLICQRKLQTDAQTPLPIIYTPILSDYSYRWRKVRTIGQTPAPRYFHTAVILPISASARVTSENLATRMLVYGGAIAPYDIDPTDEEFACLRISDPISASGNNGHDAVWEDIEVVGPRPSCSRYMHSMQYIESANLCLIFGGKFYFHPYSTCNDLWALSWSHNPHYDATIAESCSLRFHWQLIDNGNEVRRVQEMPIPRSDHTFHIIETNKNGDDNDNEGNQESQRSFQMFIFGGQPCYRKVNQRNQKKQDKPMKQDQNKLQRETVKDSILYLCQLNWSPNQLKGNNQQVTTDAGSDKAKHGSDKVEDDEEEWEDIDEDDESDVQSQMDSDDRKPPIPSHHWSVKWVDMKENRSIFLSYDPSQLFTNFSSSAVGSHPNVVVSPNLPPDNTVVVGSYRSCSLPVDLQSLVFTTDEDTPDWKKSLFDRSLIQTDTHDPIVPNFKLEIPPGEPDSATEESFKRQTLATFASLVRQRCPVFDMMLSSDMIEAQSGVVKISSASFGSETSLFYQRLLNYLNSGFVDSAVSIEDQVHLLELSNEYGLNALTKRCEGELLQVISFLTVCEILNYAEWLDLSVLRMACYGQLLRSKNIKELISANESKIAQAVEQKEIENGEEILDSVSFRSFFIELSEEARIKFIDYASIQGRHSFIADVAEVMI